MIQRVWRCTLRPGGETQYEEFARSISLPMFRKQKGYRGCVMARSEAQCEVLTLWEDEASLDAVGQSQSYQETLASIRAADFIAEELGTTTMLVHEAELLA